jgi:hypothetical protein
MGQDREHVMPIVETLSDQHSRAAAIALLGSLFSEPCQLVMLGYECSREASSVRACISW